MGKQPAVIIIVRHGARLDAADKQWHFTSPTPYDPPLTYGGWLQSRALGNRIASILHARELGTNEQPANGSLKKPSVPSVDEQTVEEHTESPRNDYRKGSRKHKIYIHTSPFLRCIQTSIAVSSGLGQFQGTLQTGSPNHGTRQHHMHSEMQHPAHSSSPHIRGAENWNVPHLSAIPEPGSEEVDNHRPETFDQAKATLRIDPFLGEWLSPDYFELITPPPNSVMMLAGAKAELMHHGDYVDVPSGSNKTSSTKGHFPGGWSSNTESSTDIDMTAEKGPLSTVSSIGRNLPRLNRASSHSDAADLNSVSKTRSGQKSMSKIEISPDLDGIGYRPPTPSYAISPSDPIPPGYVAHARNACVDVDSKWDSMRAPYDWGDGGEFGEEWSAMHKRFRRGLQSMILSYQCHRNVGVDMKSSQEMQAYDDEEDPYTDTVLILITHGAGCNALIGALTNQPVLLDVGMASLSMAVRKASSSGIANAGLLNRSRRRSSVGSTIADEYEMKITASTDHLRSGTRSSPKILPNRSPSLSSSPIATHRYRANSTASSTSSIESDFKLETENRSMTSTGNGKGLSKSAGSSAGLWSKPISRTLDGSSEQLQLHKEKPPQLSGHSPLAKEVSTEAALDKENSQLPAAKSSLAHGAPGHPTTQHGLWGAPPATMAAEREKGPKRRWTHSEQR